MLISGSIPPSPRPLPEGEGEEGRQVSRVEINALA